MRDRLPDTTGGADRAVGGKYFSDLNLKGQMVNYMAKTTENMGDTLVTLIDKLAGKGSDLKLSFQDLTLEVGMMKTKLNGSIVIDILFIDEKK